MFRSKGMNQINKHRLNCEEKVNSFATAREVCLSVFVPNKVVLQMLGAEARNKVGCLERSRF